MTDTIELTRDGNAEFLRREVKTIEKSSVKGEVEGRDFKHYQFIDIGAREVEFINCDFSYAVIERSYFYKARFTNCKFVGARFHGCNFRSATFTMCDFRYAYFSETVVTAKEIINNLPDWHNIRMELLRVLRVNAASVGDYRSEKLLIKEELNAEREHLRRARVLKEQYYTKKYKSTPKRVEIWFRSVLFWLDGVLWGHGENFLAPVASTLMLIALTAGYIAFQKEGASLQSVNDAFSSWGREFFTVLFAFLDVDTNTLFGSHPYICSVVVLVRYVFLGLIVAALYRRVAHR